MSDTAPRYWGAPTEPDLTVSRVAGRDGRQWQRIDGLGGRHWETVQGFPVYHLSWPDLFWEQGPLTEVQMR